MFKVYEVEASYGDPDYPYNETIVVSRHVASEEAALALMQEGLSRMKAVLKAQWDERDAFALNELKKLLKVSQRTNLTAEQREDLEREMRLWGTPCIRNEWEIKPHSAWLEDGCIQYHAFVKEIEVEGMDALDGLDPWFVNPKNIDFDEPLPKAAEDFYRKAYALLK